MRVLVLAGALLLAACGQQPHEYPPAARAQFDARCQMGEAACACMWDKITKTIPHTEYEAAMTRFEAEGLMDPRVTRARTECLAGG